MTHLAALLAITTACGRIAFGEAGVGGGDEIGVDATIGTTSSDGSTGNVVVNLQQLNSSGADDDPTVTADLLELYYTSIRSGGPGGSDIFRTTRSTVDAPWGAPTRVVEINSSSNEETPGVSADGLTLWFASDRPGLGNFDIYVATRADRGSPWSAPTLVNELSSTGIDQACEPSTTNVRIVCIRWTGNRWDLFESVRTNVNAPWSAPVFLSELNTSAEDVSPFLVAGDLEIWFASDRSGSREVYRAARPALGQPFGKATLVEDLASSSTYNDDPWRSADDRYVVFSSNRGGSLDVWELRR